MDRKVIRCALALLLAVATWCHAGLYESGGAGTAPLVVGFSSGTNNFNTSTTLYWPSFGSGMVGQTGNYGATSVLITAPFPGVLRNLSCLVGTALTSTQQLAITAEAGTGTSTLTCTINSSSTCSHFPNSLCTSAGKGCEDITHAWPVNKGDLMDFKTVPANSPTVSPISCSAELDPIGATNPVPQIFTVDTGATNLTGGSTTQYIGPNGTNVTPSSGGNVYSPIVVPGILRNLVCAISNAMTSTMSYTITPDISGTALSCLINSSSTATGMCAGYPSGRCCSDTTHAQVLNPGDSATGQLEWKIVPANSATASSIRCGAEFDPTGGASPTIPVYTKSADYTITAGDLAQSQEIIFNCDTSGATRAITLPAASAVPWKKIRVKRLGTTNACTISRAGSDTIYDTSSGGTSKSLSSDGASAAFVSDGSSTWTVQ